MNDAIKNELNGFKTFLEEQKITGTAIGFVAGAGAGDVVNKLVESIINPIIGLITSLFTPGNKLGSSLELMQFTINGVVFKWGAFLSSLINFLIVCFVIYFIVKKLTQLGKKVD